MASKYPRRQFLGQLAALGAAVTTVPQYARAMESTLFAPAGEKSFVPVMITPFTSDLKIDYKGLSALTDLYLASGAKGLFANCLSSEMYYLSDEERLELVKHVVKHVNHKVSVVATGSFGNNLTAQAEFAKKMHQTGVDGVILITSHFASREESDDVMMTNIDKFLALTEGIPLGTYECPSPYKRILTPATFKHLIDSKRFIYHKDTTLDQAKIKVKLDLCRGTGLQFYDAHAPNGVFSLQNGAKGLSCIAGNLYPEIFSWLCENVNNPARSADVSWIQEEITRLDDVIGNGYSLNARYVLNKRGLNLQVVNRASKSPLTAEQIKISDDVYKTVLQWHERLGIKV
ncbi:dihydrodipicolinate synthase family protein [Chryseolinea sp. T2]|uniref:dihydrodipicolinate synthase family protein n=1 Tax=Chryseolinea sp. T2 TaxID=3129255 RepID=UPI003077DD3B